MNKVILVGYVGKDPEIKTLDSGKKASFSLATRVKKDESVWHNIVAFGNVADVIERYIHKGSLLAVTGEIRYRNYEKDNVRKYITEIIVNNIEMLGKKEDRKPDDLPAEAPTEAPADDLPF